METCVWNAVWNVARRLAPSVKRTSRFSGYDYCQKKTLSPPMGNNLRLTVQWIRLSIQLE